MDVNNLPRVGTPPRADESSNPRPLNRKSNVVSFGTTRYYEIQHLAVAKFYSIISFDYLCLQCFDAVGWVAGRASGL